jgi:hypothetical protein
MENRRKRVSLVGPAILIIIGIVLLLNNLGWTTISVWDLLRLWPVLLIAGGLEILIGQRSTLASLLVLIAMLALLGGGVWLLTSSRSPGALLEGEEISQSLRGATSAEVDIGFGVGTLRVRPMSDPDKLILGEAELHRGEKLEQEFRVSGDTAIFGLRSTGNWSAPFFGWEGDKVWDLALNRDVPIKLDIDAGVGDAAINLERLDLSELSLNMGVGRMTATLPMRGDLSAKIDGGVGELFIKVPEGMEVRVRANAGLGNTSVPSAYRREGDVYVSPGYGNADNRIDLTLEIGLGRIVIQEYLGE